MSTLGIYGTQCSLTGWPSLSQFDDFVWMGLGEIDSLDNIAQSTSTGDADHKSSPGCSLVESQDCLQLSNTVHDSNIQKVRSVSKGTEYFPNLPQPDFLANCRWDSINASDLASILDSIPCKSILSIPTTEDGCALYNDELSMQPEQIFSGEDEIFMAAPICEATDVITAASSSDVMSSDFNSAGKDSTSLVSSQHHDILTDCNWDIVGDMESIEKDINSCIFGGMLDDSLNIATVAPPSPSLLDSTVQRLGASQSFNGNSEQWSGNIDPTSNSTMSIPTACGSKDVGIMNQCSQADSKSQLSASEHPSIWSDSKLQFQAAVNEVEGLKEAKCTPKARRGQIVLSPHSKPVDSARVSSQIKIIRAQASRARRLAASRRRAEGRAKKYPLHKLIRMSSPSASGMRDRVSQNLATLVPMLQTPGNMVSQSFNGLAGGAQFLHTNEIKQQSPTVSPIVMSGPTVTPIHTQHLYPFVSSNPLQVDPNFKFQYRQSRSQYDMQIGSPDKTSVYGPKEMKLQPIQKAAMTSLTRVDQENGFSSESSIVQFPLSQQPMQSLPKAPGSPFQSNVSSSTALKGIDLPFVAESLEATMLEQLESTVRKLNEQTRLCIRDSLYRLANSAKQRQNEAESSSVNSFASQSHAKISCKDATETQTNPMDRWIVNLLFCKQPNAVKDKSQLYPLMPSESTNQIMEAPNMNENMQPWNSSRSFVKAEEISLCTY